MKIVLYCDYETDNLNVNNVKEYVMKKINVPGLTISNVFVEPDNSSHVESELKPGEQYIFEKHKTSQKSTREKIETYHDYDDISNMPVLT